MLILGLGLTAGAVQNSNIASSFTDPFKNNTKEKQDVFIEANELDYDFNQKLVTATGKVEILKGETVLFANKISYYQENNYVVAEGDVVVSGPSGETFFTDEFVLKDDLSDGVINYFSAKLSDGSLIAAAQAKRSNDNIVELKKAVYSACPVCKGESPLWQIKAEDIELDEEGQTITYHDAFMEVYGVPVMYTPYFSHPTPNADRKSGVLSPTISSDSNLGAVVAVPYYWNIDSDMDLTFTPIYTSDEGMVAATEFRHLTPYGEYEFSGSFTRPDKLDNLGNKLSGKETRGHLKGQGLFDITENWDFGFDGEVASDDTYLRRYNFGNQDLLTSRAFLSRQKDRDYSIFQTVYFQGLLEQDNQDSIPFAPIYTKNHYETEKGIIPGFKESRLIFDSKSFSVNRKVGEESSRGSATVGLSVPMIFEDGHLIEFKGSVRGDYFDIEDSTINNGENYNETRLIPEASIEWKMPLIKEFEHGSKLLVEPIIKAVISPNTNYNQDIPNEDSQDVEFSHLNLFSNNRYRGIDRVENGTRFHYGIKGGLYEKDNNYTYSIGQSYRVNEDRTLNQFDGLEDNLSDYVGNFTASFYNTLDFSYRFRFDKDNFKARRNEIDASLDLDPVELNLNYTFLKDDPSGFTNKREEVSGSAKIALTDQWGLLMGGRRNLASDSNVDAYGGLSYEGECININATVQRDFISDRDVDSNTSFNFQLGLKNLGNL